MRLNAIQRDLVVKYKWLSDNLAYKYYDINHNTHVGIEDLQCVAMEALCKAAYNYKQGTKASFKTYAKRAIINNLLSAIPKLVYNVSYPHNILICKNIKLDKTALEKMQSGFGCKVSVDLIDKFTTANNKDIDRELDLEKLSKFVRRVLNRMPPEMATILRRVYSIEQEHADDIKDLAKEYDIALRNVYSRIYRAQKKFRKICGEQIDFYI